MSAANSGGFRRSGGGNSKQRRSATRAIHAPAEEIFAVLSDPQRHRDFDGSGTVAELSGPGEILTLGSTFGMKMRLGPIPYTMHNTVVEHEPNRLIAWRHLGRHRWRYELDPIDDNTTRVTETFDWSTAPKPMGWFFRAAGVPKRNQAAIAASLDRLAELVEPTSPSEE